jgi:TonB family protein
MLQLSLALSIFAHSLVIFGIPLPFLAVAKNKDVSVQVHYIKLRQEKKIQINKAPGDLGPLASLPSIVTADKTSLPASISRNEVSKLNKELSLPGDSFTKPASFNPQNSVIKKKITLISNDSEKISTPSYIAHSQLVREKIRRALYQNCNRMEGGQVYLTFILTQDGYLREIHIQNDKSSASPYLRELAIRSVKDASPFPNFPKGLDYDQLSFNVTVSFEVE